MAHVDSRGLPLTAPSAAATEQYESVLDDIYYYRVAAPERLDALLQAYPEFGLARVLKGYAQMGEGALSAHPRAAAQLALAEGLPANPREQLHQAALRAWIAQDFAAAGAAWDQILAEWPLDLLALRQHTGNLFWGGDKARQAAVSSAVAHHWGPQTPGYGHFLSAHAFALEEIGDYEPAERLAREAIEIQPEDLWALHGLTHVFEMQGRVQEGVDLLTGTQAFLDHTNLFRGHLWWHLALLRITQGRLAEALELFDTEIYPQPSGFFLDIQNGASLLARLEFQGVQVGAERWERLAQASLKSAGQCTLWFTAMHHAMALARAGRETELRAALSYMRAAGVPEGAVAHDVSQAAADFCQDRPAEALERMLAVQARRGDLGASHAQQDLYDQIMITAALQLGDLARVRALLTGRAARRPWAAPVPDALDPETVRAALRWA